jgi:hypothetical protein
MTHLFIAVAVWFSVTTGEITETALIDATPRYLDECLRIAKQVKGDGAVGACVDVREFKRTPTVTGDAF